MTDSNENRFTAKVKSEYVNTNNCLPLRRHEQKPSPLFECQAYLPASASLPGTLLQCQAPHVNVSCNGSRIPTLTRRVSRRKFRQAGVDKVTGLSF